MTITAKVHNHTITLPADLAIEDGAEVQIIVPEKEAAVEEGVTLYDTLKDFIGAAKGLPEDFATEHDHYLHGTRKRSEG